MNKQEQFWKGAFGDEYHKRNVNLEATNTAFFAKALERCEKINSILELGAGNGQNTQALHVLFPKAELWSVEINKDAAQRIPHGNVIVGSILDFTLPESCKPDLVFTKGVLIHIDPVDLPMAYKRLVESTGKYILIAEYFSNEPQEIVYRGHKGVLWKRDFAKELRELYEVTELDYGFCGKHPNWPQDDISYVLLEKP